MKEDLILIKDIRQGCYSFDPEKRANAIGGFLMQAGARYRYFPGPSAHYACGTHIIYEKDLPYHDDLIEASKYEELVMKVKSKLKK